MASSIFFARWLGIIFVILCLGILINQRNLKSIIDEVISHPIYLFLLGLLDLILGTAIVLLHNFWSWNWTVVITLIGWLILIRGALRIWFPNLMLDYAKKLNKQKHQTIIQIVSFVFLVLGLFLLYKGFADPSVAPFFG